MLYGNYHEIFTLWLSDPNKKKQQKKKLPQIIRESCVNTKENETGKSHIRTLAKSAVKIYHEKALAAIKVNFNSSFTRKPFRILQIWNLKFRRILPVSYFRLGKVCIITEIPYFRQKSELNVYFTSNLCVLCNEWMW